MLTHLQPDCRPPERVVILGAGGFVGGSIAKRLLRDRISVVPLARKDLELLDKGADRELGKIIQTDDSLIVVSAAAPCCACKNTVGPVMSASSKM